MSSVIAPIPPPFSKKSRKGESVQRINIVPKHPSKLHHAQYEQKMRDAVEDVVKNQLPLKQAAQKYNLSKSALHRKVQKYKNADEVTRDSFKFGRQHGFKCVFTSEEETLFVEYLIQVSEMCYGLTLVNIRELAYRHAVANGKEMPAS
ncbi:hypothetical protein CBL_01769 [Carabus blaptoides fortunei]